MNAGRVYLERRLAGALLHGEEVVRAAAELDGLITDRSLALLPKAARQLEEEGLPVSEELVIFRLARATVPGTANTALDAFPRGEKDVRAIAREGKKYATPEQVQNLIEELRKQPEPEPPPPQRSDAPGSAYLERDGRIFWWKETRDGSVDVPLSNFTARIRRDLIRDDGQERSFEHEVEVRLAGITHRGRVPSQGLTSLSWVTEIAGSRAIVSPGMGLRDQCRAAIQTLSGEIPRSVVYTHSGWRRIGDGWAYLHGGGAIAAHGPIPGIEVELEPGLAPFCLPDPPEDPRPAVGASLALRNVAPLRLTVLLIATTYRAAIGEVTFSVHYHGGTGRRKTTITELGMQHFGAGFGGHPPTSWEATPNAIESVAFSCKDALLLIDDFQLDGTAADRARRQQAAARLFRGLANRTGRDRMRADTRLRPAKVPRCLPLSTGEEHFEGRSLNARIVNAEVSACDIEVTDHLNRAQKDASQGRYAEAMAAFLQWLASRLEEVRERIATRTGELRRGIDAGHDRAAASLAELIATWEVVLAFALEVGAIKSVQPLLKEGTEALLSLAEEQRQRQQETDPATRFLELLVSAITSEQAHVAAKTGREPENPARWGWRLRVVGFGDNERDEWQPQGRLIGWVEGDNLYLDPNSAFEVVQRAATATDQPLGATAQTLWKRLMERRLLASHDHDPDRTTIRVRLQGAQRRVLHLRMEALSHSTGGHIGHTGHGKVESEFAEAAAVTDFRHRKSVTEIGTGHGDRSQQGGFEFDEPTAVTAVTDVTAHKTGETQQGARTSARRGCPSCGNRAYQSTDDGRRRCTGPNACGQVYGGATNPPEEP